MNDLARYILIPIYRPDSVRITAKVGGSKALRSSLADPRNETKKSIISHGNEIEFALHLIHFLNHVFLI